VQQSDGRVFLGQLHLAVVVVYIHLHLAEVLMGQLVELEIDQDEYTTGIDSPDCHAEP